MATTSERTDNNVNKKEGEEEAKQLQSSLNDGEQGDKTPDKVNDLNQTGKIDTLSSVQSTEEDKKSDQISPTSDTNTEKKNEEKPVETTTTTQQKEESGSPPVSSNSNNDEDSKKDESTSQLAASNSNQNKKKDNDNTFPIETGDEQHLTDFQRQKAKYFFNVNLDIENKEYVTWEDVEFYLLFHVTAAGKEGSDGGDLEARLSRAARAFWEHIHDQIPLADGKRDRLTLDQFLDTWASLIDYIVQTNKLPPIIQDLVQLGFELYSTNNGDGKSSTIQPQAFDQLFQKMNLGRPFAIMAYKYLTDNGTKPLDADKIDSIVKAVVTSSDDEHDSHFLLPGFFKTISNNEKDNKNKSPSPVQDEEQSKVSEKSSPPHPQPSTSQPQQSNVPSSPPPQEQQKSNEPPSQSQQQNGPSSPPTQEKKPDSSSDFQKQSDSTSQNEIIKSAPSPEAQKAVIQQEDENIRRLLRYYHIDDGDIVEVAGGSVQRLVLVHPERPLPPYIRQNKELLQRLQSDLTNVSFLQQNRSNASNNNQNPSQETKPTITLEERVSRGAAQKGPTTPLRQEQKEECSSSIGVRQVYPQLSEAQQEEQRKQAKLQAKQPLNDKNQTKEETSTANDVSLSSKENETKQTKDISRDDEEKIVAAVLKQLAPIVEKRVASELRRIQSGATDQDEDDNIIQFPFMLNSGFPFFTAPRGGPPPQVSREQQQNFQQNASGQGQQQEVDFGGLQGGAALFPPQLIMAMMNDLARGDMGGEIPRFPPNMPLPPHGPAGVEGFMMFVDDDQLMGGPPVYPPRPGPRF